MVVKVVNTRTGEEVNLSSIESAESLVEKSDDWIFAKKEQKPEVEDLGTTEEGGKWDSLKERAKSQTNKPPNWHPKVDDWLLGSVVSTGTGTNSRFAEVEIQESVRAKEKSGEDEYEIKTVEPGETVLLWESTTLKDLFDQLTAGMDLAVQYVGKQTTRSGQKRKFTTTQ